jgi:glucose/mannose-6-phosphate isomerase
MTQFAFLDDRAQLLAIDSKQALASIEQLASQIQEAWTTAKALTIPAPKAKIQQVVVAGMGGSILGTHVIQTVFKEELRVPIIIAPDYTVPHFVNEHTLVVASSYSGSTEETLAAVQDAQKKGAQIVGITSGGKLAEWLNENNYPCLQFPTTYNPSNSPRMALGYSIFGQMALLSKTGILNLDDSMYQEVLDIIAAVHLDCSVSIEQGVNQAKLLAFEMLHRLPIVTVAEHLEGAAHVFANQINENAKTYSEFRVVPELNHHLMEGLQFPDSNRDNLLFVMVTSGLYEKSNQRRMELTQQVMDENDVHSIAVTLKGETKLSQAFELITISAYASYYLAMLNNQDPVPNPWVDWFKAELKK